MSRDIQLKERWEKLVNILSDQFFARRRFRFRRYYLPNWNSGIRKIAQKIQKR